MKFVSIFVFALNLLALGSPSMTKALFTFLTILCFFGSISSFAKANVINGEFFGNMNVETADKELGNPEAIAASTAHRFCQSKNYRNQLAFYFEVKNGAIFLTDVICSDESRSNNSMARVFIMRNRQARGAKLRGDAVALLKSFEGAEIDVAKKDR